MREFIEHLNLSQDTNFQLAGTDLEKIISDKVRCHQNCSSIYHIGHHLSVIYGGGGNCSIGLLGHLTSSEEHQFWEVRRVSCGEESNSSY